MQFGSGVILQEDAGSTADTGARAQAGATIDNVAGLVPGHGPRSAAGRAALAGVARGILERVGRYGTLRLENIPAMWPMTRHLVRRVADRLVASGFLQQLPDGTVRLTDAGEMLVEQERREG